MLEGARDAEPRDPELPPAGYGLAVKADDAGARRERTGQQIEGRGLAGAVRPNQAQNFAGPDLEAEAVDGRQPLEAAIDVFEREQGRPGVGSARRDSGGAFAGRGGS